MMFSVFFRQANQRLADFVWIMDLMKDKMRAAGRGFNSDIAIMKQRGEKAVDFHCYILNAKQIKLGNCAGE